VAAYPVTFGLIGVTVAVFSLQVLSQALVGFDLVLSAGAKVNEAIAQGQVWRLFTPIFIHAGLSHLFINMYSLYAIGPSVERFFGRPRTLAIYLLAGIAGVLLSLAMSPNPSVGASGAIFGLLGALGVLLYRNRPVFGGMGRRQLQQIVLVALFNLALGLSPGIDNWGHLGGLVYGSGLAWFAGPLLEVVAPETDRPRVVDHRPWEEARPALLLGAALLIALSLAAML
jgi:rhomboid protease GluP